ncbi:MAG TPA: sigma-70 family RNA polymerase sigma factor [Thermoanaerobaculia bacterium]
MNVADLEWSELIDLLLQDVRTRTGPRRTEVSEMYDVSWAEFGVRLSNLARVLRRPRQWVFGRGLLDDVVQQIILRFQSEEMMGRLAAADSPPSYLAAMVRNALTDAERAVARSKAAIERVEPMGFAFDEQYESFELRQLLSALAPDDRQLLHLRFWRGLTIAEIAAELGISYSAAAMRIVRLLGKLRRAM